MEIHRILGRGVLEIIYRDALAYELQLRSIEFEREKEFFVAYKKIILPHKFYADFVVFDKIILEIKTVDCFNNNHYNQCLSYLKVSKNELALLVNFNSVSLEYKRIALSKK